MSWRQSLEVARWEFLRFVKPKQMIVSFLITLAVGAMGYGFARLANRGDRVVDVAVIGTAPLAQELVQSGGAAPTERLRLRVHDAGALDSLRAAVSEKSLGGVLVLRGIDSAEVIVARDPAWLGALETQLSAARQSVAVRDAGIDPARLAYAFAPMQLRTTLLAERGGTRARIVSMVAAGVVLYCVFTASMLMFVSITGEKQLRVTEQMLSAISPQRWMDGKIIGISAATVVTVAITLLGGVLFVVGRRIATGDSPFAWMAVDPAHLALTIPFAALGFAFWMAFLGGVAATVDDPNTSTRGPLLFVPALLSTPALMIARNPDSVFARVMSLLPPSAPAVMPARLALTDVAWWEVTLSLLFLALATWALRRAAGRIFAVAMLLYGKEPSWGEVRRLAMVRETRV